MKYFHREIYKKIDCLHVLLLKEKYDYKHYACTRVNFIIVTGRLFVYQGWNIVVSGKFKYL